MKKFISCVMAAAMVASLVPATAFAVSENGDVKATAKVVNPWSVSRLGNDNKVTTTTDYTSPEVQLDITSVNYKQTLAPGKTDKDLKQSFNLILDNADWIWTNEAKFIADNISIWDEDGLNIIGEWDATPTTGGTADTYTFTTDATNGAFNTEALQKAAIKQQQDTPGTEYFLKDADDNYVSMKDVLKELEESIDEEDRLGAPDPTVSADVKIANALAELTEHETTGSAIGDVPANADGTGSAWKKVENLKPGMDGFICTTASDDGNITVGMEVLLAETTACAGIATFAEVTGGVKGSSHADVVAAYYTALAASDYATGYQFGTRTTTPGTPGTPAVGGPGYYDGNRKVRVGDIEVEKLGDDEIKVTVHGKFKKGDTIAVNLESIVDRAGVNRTASVSVDSDMVTADDLTYVSVLNKGVKVSVKKVETVAEEEKINIHKNGMKFTSTVDDFAAGQEFELKLSKGFEFSKIGNSHPDVYTISRVNGEGKTLSDDRVSVVCNAKTDEFTIDANDLEIEATSAKSGATATITVKAIKDKNDDETFADTATVEVMKVVDYKVNLTVDEDEDVPVIYSGVNTDNYGITDNSDHWSIEVTAEESFPGAWSFRKGFNFELPEHVHVIDVEVKDTDGLLKSIDTAKDTAATVSKTDVEWAFFDAYQDGSHKNFEFKKRVFDDVDATLNKEEATMTFKLQLTADPGFEGDVVLKLTGDLVDEQEVTIAKFVKPYEVKAEQNDLKIDYRYTDVATSITVTEAEAGLWAEDEATFKFHVERGDMIQFEDDGTVFEATGGLKVDGDVNEGANNINQLTFDVEEESDTASTVTISNIKLFMQRNIPAGPYDLKIGSTLEDKFLEEVMFAPDCVKHTETWSGGVITHTTSGTHDSNHPKDNDCIVDHVDDYSSTVKEAFVNVITAGREVDDASFTTKVVVPVGENYIVAGEKQIELDTPAYINAAGYTMLPIRAVAVALGINSNNVLWDQPTKTVTILYGQRIITMTQGQKVVYVNGSAIPASAAVENTNSRTFLPMRDLATALGVTDITWDQATRTATLNGSQK